MSTTETARRPAPSGRPTEAIPAVPQAPMRRSILAAARAGASPAPTSPFAGWRGQARTEEMPAAPSCTERLAVRR